MFPILAFETRSYISNKMAIFWTVAYPIAMLSLLISIFDPGLATDDVFASYRFKNHRWSNHANNRFNGLVRNGPSDERDASTASIDTVSIFAC